MPEQVDVNVVKQDIGGPAAIAANWPTAGTLEELPTFGGKSKFVAEFLANNEIRLLYGGQQAFRKLVGKAVLEKVAAHYGGATIPLTGAGSLDEWLTANFCKTHLAPYIGTVLVKLGYAVRDGENVRFH
jgi:hypothetical protein